MKIIEMCVEVTNCDEPFTHTLWIRLNDTEADAVNQIHKVKPGRDQNLNKREGSSRVVENKHERKQPCR